MNLFIGTKEVVQPATGSHRRDNLFACRLSYVTDNAH